MKVFLYIVTGVASGLASGALGVGGAVIATPMIRLLGVTPHLAVGTTVPAILPSTLTGTIAYWRRGLVDRRAALIIAAGGAVAAFVGARFTRAFNGHILMIATATLLFILAIRLFPDEGPRIDDGARSAAWPGLLGLGVGTGLLSGLLGVGGGLVIVPVLIRTFGMEVKKALGTSLAVITLTVIPNILGQMQAGNIDWQVALLISAGVIPGARLGAALTIREAEGLRLRRVLAILLSAIAATFGIAEVIALL